MNFNRDDYMTPESAVNLILPYVKKFNTIWCPFDKEDSNFVKIFKENGINIINTHIDYGNDFFNFMPKDSFDAIVSNPPFSKLDKVIQRLYEINKPYAIIMPVHSLQGKTKFRYIKDTAQILIPEDRIQFLNPITKSKLDTTVSFSSCYLCKDVLPERLLYI